jgi:predicted SnoaL-like aldol condensation-catalyzing enzyme
MKFLVQIAFMFLVSGSAAKAEVPVTPAIDQDSLLTSPDPKLVANKRLVYDFWRIIIVGRHLDQAARFLREDYIQHNPNVKTGLQGFLEYFRRLGPPRDIPSDVPGLVTIRAEGDLVTMALVSQKTNTEGIQYSTTWFDMFRIQDGRIAEHWDCALLNPVKQN